MDSMFKTLPQQPVDPILGLFAEFETLAHPKKVNLGVGIYQTDTGETKVFEAVQIAEKELENEHLDKKYLPIQGDPVFLKKGAELVFEELSQDPSLIHCQSVGGTSALYTAGKFLERAGFKKLYLPNPTWPNHNQLFSFIGFELKNYGYPGFKGIEEADSESIILVHASCHNPTGIDPSREEWSYLFDRVQNQGSCLLFDSAYQGLGEGLEEDAWAFKEAIKRNIASLVATSFSKNFGLYGERIGLLSLSVAPESEKERLISNLKSIIRVTYSNPPLQGARIVSHILKSKILTDLWKRDLNKVRDRLKKERESLSTILPQIKKGNGLFALTGFSSGQVDRLKKEFGCLMPLSGRINISGLNSGNIEWVKQAFKAVM